MRNPVCSTVFSDEKYRVVLYGYATVGYEFNSVSMRSLMDTREYVESSRDSRLEEIHDEVYTVRDTSETLSLPEQRRTSGELRSPDETVAYGICIIK